MLECGSDCLAFFHTEVMKYYCHKTLPLFLLLQECVGLDASSRSISERCKTCNPAESSYFHIEQGFLNNVAAVTACMSYYFIFI